ncbi:MAG: phospho-sugar mutase [Gammaproteobacteria bacterium]|nr:phospho-sugar mutase [Gammaproteobacteria bacterium]
MSNIDIYNEYKKWVEHATEDPDLVKDLKDIENDDKRIEDAFYRNLEFGTGGLRGVIGAGTNRMNIYMVRKASQGLANYVLKKYPKNPSIAVSFDSRIKSTLFAHTASEVFAANGIKVHIYKELMPTPCLSYAVRELNCSAGIMVTASHNPSKYNGYKVYGSDGCQITTQAASEILAEINALDVFKDPKHGDYDALLKENKIEIIKDDLYTKFINRVKEETLLVDEPVDKNVKIIYSPLHGTGLKPVTRILKESGFNNVIVVKEQEEPDGNFTTCPYPNPEIKEAMQVGIEYAKKNNADILIATDPDADRVGIAVKDKDDYKLLTGNQVGVLLLDYICSLRIKHNKMPKNPIAIKTIVTTDMVKKVADKYGVQIVEVLTGFKFIGEQIGLLETKGEENRYIFGFEESYGYLSGGYVRDKDAVDGTFLIAEMFAYYKHQGISLISKLNKLYDEFGYFSNYLDSFEFEGSSGFAKMSEIMDSFRNKIREIGNYKVIDIIDYEKGVNGLPKSNVLKLFLDNGTTIVVRPSGTEPKLKMYTSICGDNFINNDAKYKEHISDVKELLK